MVGATLFTLCCVFKAENNTARLSFTLRLHLYVTLCPSPTPFPSKNNCCMVDMIPFSPLSPLCEDYDAPLSEWGSVNKKYLELRKVLSEMVPESLSRDPLPPIPPPVPTAGYGEITMTLYISLLSTLQYVPVSFKSTYCITA